MRLHRDCRNFEERGPTVFIHADGAGLRSEPSGGCRLGLIGFAGCPAACTERQAR